MITSTRFGPTRGSTISHAAWACLTAECRIRFLEERSSLIAEGSKLHGARHGANATPVHSSLFVHRRSARLGSIAQGLTPRCSGESAAAAAALRPAAPDARRDPASGGRAGPHVLRGRSGAGFFAARLAPAGP